MVMAMSARLFVVITTGIALGLFAYAITGGALQIAGSLFVSPQRAPKVLATSKKTVMQPLTKKIISTPKVQGWTIQSVDAMKDTKDAVCSPRSLDWINKWLDKAIELGANYVAISTPYDDPSCGSSVNYTNTWVQAIRSHGLHVWHRHMPLAFEGIYNTTKTKASFLDMISSYIISHPNFFASGDIFTPIPEPQNGGIHGVTSCPQGICEFDSAKDFNSWLRDAMTISCKAFQAIGKNGVKVGYFGFDGFVAWGDNNPDWHGILEDATVSQMGNITIDHYPEVVGETMDQGLTALQNKYPRIPIVIGEWGTITGGDTVSQVLSDMTAAKNHHVIGFNYWQFGPSGAGEQLINDDFSNRISFTSVERFYKGQD